ncbi:MAG: hypothetical protein KGJ06_05540, partial [Pseudomonadota bacterium]|nr:hypothetical protein [Pseudomonadota bacterium]
MKLAIKQATLEQNGELLEQYFQLRQNFFNTREMQLRAEGKIPPTAKARASEKTGPKWPIRGDDKAEFLLVVDEENPAAPKVMGGVRLSAYRAGVDNPSDNALKNAPEVLFPGVANVRDRKNIVYIDGAAFDDDQKFALREVINALLGGIATKMRQDKANAVLMIPSISFEAEVWAYFNPQPKGLLRRTLPPRNLDDHGQPVVVPITDFGKVTYINRMGAEVTKSLLGIIGDDELNTAAQAY